MVCKQINELLELYALEALEGAELVAVEEHMAGCEVCRARAASARADVLRFKEAMASGSEDRARIRHIYADAFAEIGRAGWGRRSLTLWVRAVAAVLILSAVSAAALFWFNRSASSCTPWQQAGIAPYHGDDAAYPLVQEKKIFALKRAKDGLHVEAFDKCSGRSLWISAFPVLGCPDVKGRSMVAWFQAEKDLYVLAQLDTENGRQLREYARTAERRNIVSQPAILDGAVCWIDSGKVSSADVNSGRLLWVSELGEKIESLHIAADSKNIYVASASALHALNLGTGAPVWKHVIDQQSAPAGRGLLLRIEGDHLLAARRDDARTGTLFCLDSAGGQLVWSRKTGAPLSLLAERGRVFLRTNEIESFEISSGRQLWSVVWDGCSPLTLSGGQLYVARGNGKSEVFALNADTGKQVQKYNLPSSCSGIVIDGRRGVISGQDGVLYAVPMRTRT